jgi:hypothetical protein
MENGEERINWHEYLPWRSHDGNQQFDQFFVVHADGGKALVGEVFGASEG